MKKRIVLIGFILGILCIIGVSYAYWRLTLSQTGINRIASTCLSLSLTNEENATLTLRNVKTKLSNQAKRLLIMKALQH